MSDNKKKYIRIELLSDHYVPSGTSKKQIRTDEFCDRDSKLFKTLSNSVKVLINVGCSDTSEFLISSITGVSVMCGINWKESFRFDDKFDIPLGRGDGLKGSPHNIISVKVYKVTHKKDNNYAFVGLYWYDSGCYSNGTVCDEYAKNMFINEDLVIQDSFPENLEKMMSMVGSILD